MDWNKAIKEFKIYLMIERCLTNNTVNAYIKDIENFSCYCSNQYPQKINRKDLIKYIFENQKELQSLVFYNFMRGKLKSGKFQRPFKADAWGGAFTEGSSWHYTWSVLHDPEGLMSLMGGRINFIERLDQVFTTPPTSDFSYYGFKIHEILEMELLKD